MDVERTMLAFKLLRLMTSIDCETRSRLYILLPGGEPLTPCISMSFLSIFWFYRSI